MQDVLPGSSKKYYTSVNVGKVEFKNNDDNDLVSEAASPRPRLLPTCCSYTRSFSATMAAILLTDVRVRLRSPQWEIVVIVSLWLHKGVTHKVFAPSTYAKLS